jgi:hypothetical protein
VKGYSCRGGYAYTCGCIYIYGQKASKTHTYYNISCTYDNTSIYVKQGGEMHIL